jgi:putative tryptophan/tyrosine transport system substrate-binding protein
MAIRIRRREFIVTLGGAAVAWPLAARAQQSAMPVIGILASVSPAPYASYIAAVKEGLRQTGYVEGRNVAIEYRWAEGQYDRLPQQAIELVDRGIAVIVLVGGGPTTAVAKAATATIPIVFVTGEDPVKSGAVASLNRPGGNATGVSLLTVAMEAKRLQLLHELMPNAAVVAIIVNPNNPQADEQLQELQAAARTLGVQVEAFKAGSPSEIDDAFAKLVERRAGALHIASDAFFNTRREQFVVLSARHALPAIFNFREFAAAGGLMSYGPSLTDAYRQEGIYAGRILKGEKPAEMPVQQAVKIELVINMQTARALGLTVPLPLLGRADEVIE